MLSCAFFLELMHLWEAERTRCLGYRIHETIEKSSPRRADEIALDVGKGAADLLAGVEDVLRIEYFFRLLEESYHLGAEEHWQVRCADDAVIVFAGRGAAGLDDHL